MSARSIRVRPAPDLPEWARRPSEYSAPPITDSDGMRRSLVNFDMCFVKLVNVEIVRNINGPPSECLENCILFLYP